MKIERIYVKGYKSIKEQTVDLKPINIIIGGNGAGKSNLISSLELLRNIYDKNLQHFVVSNMGAEGLLHWGKKVTETIVFELELENKGNNNRYGVELVESQDTLFIQKAYTSFLWGDIWRKQLCDVNLKEATIKDDRTGQAFFVGPLLSRFDVYHFHDTGPKSPMKGVKDINDNTNTNTEYDGQISWLQGMDRIHKWYY